MTEPAHKKRKLTQGGHLDGSNGPESEWEPSLDSKTRQLLLAQEFDLEIALRKRLAATIESRVAWALILQQTLSNNVTTESTPGNFENAAVEAAEVIETPCNILFDRDPTPPQIIHELLERGSRASAASESGPQPKSRTRKARSTRARPQPQGAKLLFIRDATVSPSTIAKMVCPDCGKSDFTNLQGLLNHARLRHQREYGTHDECMQACAVIVDDAEGEAEWVLKNGIELNGVSMPSVRRLFEIAVGEDRGFIDGFSAGAEENDEDAEVISSTYLSKTLGHHKDTPALAPFLGRAPKRRCINVYVHEDEVDIDDSEVTSKLSWRMSFPHRNKARPELDEVAATPSTPPRPEAEFNAQLADVPNNTSGTRFHIIARVVISDRSLWIPPERRVRGFPNHTHRWIIEVDSPSYSLHISAFLAKLTVTCITDSPPSTLSTPLTIEEPPFIISSTTDKPFLARLTLTWVGYQNVPMEVEHWVELDPFHTSIVNPVLGDEQVLDVELDRHTVLLPIRRVNASSARKHKGDESNKSDEEKMITGQSEPDEPYYSAALKSLLPRYPMTMKDVKGRTSVHHIQYKLVSTSSQLIGLVPGRRKAIEWGRARALKDAYQAIITSAPPQAAEDAIPLTTADVFRWLEDEGLFSRPVADTTAKAPPGTKKAKANPVPTSPYACLCSVCGLNHQAMHSTSAMKVESATSARVPVAACNIVNGTTNWHRMSMIDVRRPLGLPSSSISYHSSKPHVFSQGAFTSPDLKPYNPTEMLSTSRLLSSRDLVAIANPELIMAIRDVVQPLGLLCFDRLSPESSLSSFSDYPSTKSQAEAQVAPYALLASLTKSFVHLLVRSGLDAASLDMSMATAKAKADGRSVRKSKQPRDRLLTPSHIIRGLTGGLIQRGRPLTAAPLCLARLGISQPVAMGTRDLTIDAPSSEGLKEL